MQKTRRDVRDLYKKIEAILNSDEEVSIDCVYALSRTKSKIKALVEEMDITIMDLQKEERKIAIEFCDKDDEGKPMFVPIIENDKKIGERYAGLESGRNVAYDERHEAIVEKRDSYLQEKIEVTIYKLDMDKIPKKGKSFVLAALCELVEL